MPRYFCVTVEGEAPDNFDRAALREAINESLPEWARGGAFVTRLDDPDSLDRLRDAAGRR